MTLWRKLHLVWLNYRASKAALLAPVSVSEHAPVGYDHLCACGADARTVCVRGTRCAVHTSGKCEQGAAAVSEPLSRSCVLEFNMVSRIAHGHGTRPHGGDIVAAPARPPLAPAQALPRNADEDIPRTERGRGDDSHPLEDVTIIERCPGAKRPAVDILSCHD